MKNNQKLIINVIGKYPSYGILKRSWKNSKKDSKKDYLIF